MFSINFTYLKIVAITQDFRFSSVLQIILKTQHKCKLRSAKYSNCNTQLKHNANVISITDLCDTLTIAMLGIPSHR